MPPNPLTNFEIQKYYQNEAKFNGVYSRNNLPKIKVGPYIIDLDEYDQLQHVGLLCMLMIIIYPILIVLELIIFKKKLKNSQEIKIL